MGARYGRNQKRAHRARIAELTAALEDGWPQARDFDAITTLLPNRVLGWVDSESSSYDEGRVRCASLDYVMPDRAADAILRCWEREARIAWKGIAWRITDLRAEERAVGFVAMLTLRSQNRRRR